MTENTRNIGFAGESEQGTDQAVGFARSLAVVVGINNYADPIPALKTPGNDARRIKEVLEGQQKFEVLPPLTEDVTRSRLLELFTVTLPGLSLGPSDRLLVYFAGHGTEMSGPGGEPEYYLVPQDARPDDRDSFLPMRLVRDALLKLKCRHLLLVLDCCFAGGFGRMRSFDDLPPKIYRQRFDFYVSSPAWQVIASAAHDETALDTAGGYVFGRRAIGAETEHSPFASALFEALEGQADVNPASQEGEPAGDGLITAAELYVWIRDRVQAVAGTTHRQSPGLWPLPNHEAGEFVFRNPERALSLEDALPLTAGTNPYRGLNSYDEAQSHLFFGRVKQIAALAAKVVVEPFVAVLGVSGTGKSSLAKAGLIPTLGGSHRAGDPPEPRQVGEMRWLTLPPFRPTAEPVASLTRLLTDHLPTYVQQVPAPAGDATALAALVTAWRADHPGARLALVIDQFEELVTLCADKEQRQHFQALLANALAAAGDSLRVIITLRTDFEPQYNQGVLKPFWHSEARYVVLPMSQDELRQVILGPAWASEIYFESRALVEELINEVVQAPGGLPLLSFALSKMYLHYIESGRQDRTLRQADFDAVGGVIGSLRAAANTIWDNLDPDHRGTMERLMLRMIAIGGGEVARRRVAWAELDYGEPENMRRDAVIGQLEEARLVVRDKNAGWVEPAHDALVSGWDRLTEWKFTAASYLPLQRDLAPAALRWQAADAKAKSSLLWDRDPRLPQVEETLWPTGGKQKRPAGRTRWVRQVLVPQTKTPTDTKWLNRPELGFTEASVSRRASTFRRIIGITAAVIIVLAGLMLFATYQANQATLQRNEASAQRDNAISAGATAIAEGNARATEVVVRSTAEANAQRSAQAEATAAADARQKQAEAEREARRAQAGEMAVYAQTAIIDYKHDPSLALLLAKQAVETTWLAPEHMAIANASKALLVALDAAPPYIMTLPRHRHTGVIMSVGYSPDSKLIVTAGSDATARIWDAGTGEEALILIGHDAAVLSAAFSPNGKAVVTASADRTARIWDANDGKELLMLNGHANVINSARYSGDGRLIVTASDDGTARIWDATTGQQLRLLRGHTREVKLATFSPDGRFILTASNDSTARVWEEGTGKEVRTLRGSEFEVTSAVYSPDGQFIVTAGYDSTARIWDAATGEQLHELDDHTQPITSVAFSPDSNYIVTASGDGTARVWDAATGQEVRQLDDDALWLHQAAYSPDGTSIITAGADGTARIWNAAIGQMVRQLGGHAGPVASAAYSPDGKFIVTAGEDQTVRVWDAIRGAELRQLRGHDCLALSVVFRHCRVSSAEFSPDGAFIVTSGTDGTARIWNATTGEEVRQFSGHGAALYSATYSRDGKRVLTAGDDGIVRIWDAASGEELRQLIGHAGPVNSARYSPDGMSILTAGDDRTARIWDAATGQEQSEITGHAAALNRAAYSPDGRLIVTASNDNTARIWDAVTGQEIRQLSGHSQDCPESHICSVLSAAFSPDGRFIVTASADDTVFVWDATTGQEVRQLRGHMAPVLPAGISASYSPDGTMILTASDDGTARIWGMTKQEAVRELSEPPRWLNPAAYSPDGKFAAHTGGKEIWIEDIASGKKVRRLAGHTDEVQSAAFSPDGRFIVTASFALPSSLDSNTLTGPDGVVRIWDVATGKEMRQLNGHGCVNYFCGVNSARYNSDGTLIITAGADSTARIWDVATGLEVRQLVGHRCADTNRCNVRSAQFSPDGRFIVTAGDDSTARVWDVATGKELHQLTINRRDAVNSAAYSPDGLSVVTAGADGITRVWDAATGQELRQLSGYEDQIYKAAYSPDGSQIVIYGSSGVYRIWDVGIDGQLASARRLIQRDPPVLTPEERQQYGLEVNQ